jgi:hypothetical protein
VNIYCPYSGRLTAEETRDRFGKQRKGRRRARLQFQFIEQWTVNLLWPSDKSFASFCFPPEFLDGEPAQVTLGWLWIGSTDLFFRLAK